MEKSIINKLTKLLETDPLWYQDRQITDFIQLFNKENLTKSEKAIKNDLKKLLKRTNFYTGETGYNWDQWRLPVESAVIHHTSSSPTISLNELNILGLRLYIQQFLKDADVEDQPLFSGHYWYGKPAIKSNMTFVSYHYLVRPNGKIIKLVDDSAFLWHAGNLETNRRSVGIALAGKFIHKEPSPDALKAVAEIIKSKNISKKNVFGHKEVVKKEIVGDTVCPGNLFLDGWKEKIIQALLR